MQVWQVIQILCRQSPHTQVLVQLPDGNYTDVAAIEEHYPRTEDGEHCGRCVAFVAKEKSDGNDAR